MDKHSLEFLESIGILNKDEVENKDLKLSHFFVNPQYDENKPCLVANRHDIGLSKLGYFLFKWGRALGTRNPVDDMIEIEKFKNAIEQNIK